MLEDSLVVVNDVGCGRMSGFFFTSCFLCVFEAEGLLSIFGWSLLLGTF